MFIKFETLKPVRALGKVYETTITEGKLLGNDIRITNNYVNGKLKSKVCTQSGPNFMKTFWKSYDETGKVDYRSAGYGLKLDIKG